MWCGVEFLALHSIAQVPGPLPILNGSLSVCVFGLLLSWRMDGPKPMTLFYRLVSTQLLKLWVRTPNGSSNKSGHLNMLQPKQNPKLNIMSLRCFWSTHGACIVHLHWQPGLWTHKHFAHHMPSQHTRLVHSA